MQFTNNSKHCLHITYLDVPFRHTKLTFYRYTNGTHNENSFSGMQSCTTQIPSLTSKCKFKCTIKTLSANAIRLYSTQICKRRHFKTCFFQIFSHFFFLSFIIYILCTNKPIDTFYHTLYMRV